MHVRKHVYNENNLILLCLHCCTKVTIGVESQVYWSSILEDQFQDGFNILWHVFGHSWLHSVVDVTEGWGEFIPVQQVLELGMIRVGMEAVLTWVGGDNMSHA